MKKHLIALAVAGAVAVPAMAQNVTMYGTIDTGLVKTDTTGGASPTAAADSKLSSSLIGFKGSEDLGGGLKANFQLEGSLTPSTGIVGKSVTGSDNNTELFNREAWVGVSGAFGAVRIGQTDVSSHQGVDGLASNLGNQNDFLGDIGTDAASVIRYTAPTVNGFTFDVGYSNSNTTTATGVTDITGAGLSYANGPIKAAVGYAKAELTATTSTKQNAAGIQYNAGVATVAIAVNRITSDTASAERTESIYSVSVPFQGFVLAASANKDNKKAASEEDLSVTNFGVTKALSKRTTVYAIMSSYDYNGTTADKKETIVGISHKF
jgi:predicted porin